MELFNQLKGLADKVENLKDKIGNEESTKHAFILPFINILGYDAFNPLEVVPEFTADVGIKKGEKVDYAIYQNEAPILIIECKHWNSPLDVNNSSQLFRYFHVTKTRFALLTNGIVYKFYTDLVEPNKMDEKPFFEFNILKLKEGHIKEIEKFHKSNFDVDKIVNNASTLKYTSEVKVLIKQEMENPSTEFVRHFASPVYSGRLTSGVVQEFTDIIQKAFTQMINDSVNDRLNAALNKEEEKQKSEAGELSDDEGLEEENDNGIITTEEELEGYGIVLAILRRKVAKDRVYHRDTKSYFGILLDNNNRKPICRLHLDRSVKYITIFKENKESVKEQINSIDDIYNYEQTLLNIVDYYDAETV